MAASTDRQTAELATFGMLIEGLQDITTADKDTTTRASGAADERVGRTRCFTCKRRRGSGEVLDCESRGPGRVGCGARGEQGGERE